MARVPRPIFRRAYEFVAIRPIRRAKDVVIEPGEEVKSDEFRLHHLRSLYERRRIGPKDHPWTEAMLKSTGFPKLMPKDDSKSEKDPDVVKDELPEVPEGFDDAYTIDGADVSIESVVQHVIEEAGMTVKGWARMAKKKRIEAVQTYLDTAVDDDGLGDDDPLDD